MAEIYNTKSNTLLSGTSSDDSIYNDSCSQVSINTSAGSDSVYNSFGDSVTINTGTGNDYVGNEFGCSMAIDTGLGNDYVYNCGSTATINTGEGNDSVYNDYSADSVTIDTGVGNDSIYNRGTYITINGGAGNDTIKNYGNYVLFNYASDDGNDIIYGFKANSTLSISSGSYSTQENGNDVLVKVGSETICLKNVYASADKIHINGDEITLGRKKVIKLTKGDDEISVYRDSVSIDTGAGNDSVFNGGNSVSIDAGAGNDYIDNYYRQSVYLSSCVSIDAGKGNDSVHNYSSSVIINTGAGNDFVYNSGTGNYVTINTSSGNDYINNWGNYVLFKYETGDGNDIIYGFNSTSTLSINGGSYSTTKSDDNIIITVGDGKITLNGAASLSKVNIKFKETSTETNAWKLSGTRATYGTSTNTLITVTGVKSLDGISLSGKVVTVAAASLNQAKVTLSGDGYTLKLANDVSTTAKTSNDWSYKNSVATLKQTKGAAYSLANDGKTISYSAGTSKTLATVSGVKSASGLSLKKKVITVAQAALNKSKVTLSGSGYTLKLANDVSTTATTSNTWSYKSSVATLKQTKGAYYSLASDGKTISYSAGTSKTLATVSGVKSASGLSVKNKVITVAQAALNKSKVTLSGSGYTLKLANDVSTTATTSNAWSYKNSVATLGQTKGEKYSLASNGKSISYSAGTSSTLATVSGAKSKSGLSFNGNKITLKNSALNKKVTISGGYEFDFAGDYKKAAITGSAKADTITSRGNNISITGGKGNDVINLAATAKNNMIVYKSGDGKDIINGLTEDDTIKIASGAAQVSASGSDVIFTVGKGSLTVKDAAEKTFTYIAGGVKETYSTVAAEPYTISGAAIVLSTSYSKNDFNVADYGEGLKTIDASAATHALNITGNDNDNKILGSTSNDTLDGYTGNDSLTGGDGSDIFLYYEGDGNDVITDYTANDTIAIEDGEVIPTVKGRDVVLNVGEEKITVQNAAKNKIGVTYTENGVEYDYLNGEQTVILNEKKTSAVVTKNYWKNSLDMANFGKSIITADATSITHELKITGNDKANKILGGSNKNTLAGGGGNDTLQSGDKADVFIYNKGDGNDIIYGYGEDDIISVTSGAVNNVKVKGDTVILTVGKGKISIEGAVAEATNITYYDENGRTSKIYSKENTNVVEPLWCVEDDDNFVTGNELGAIIQSDSVDYSFLSDSTRLTEKNNLVVCSNKK